MEPFGATIAREFGRFWLWLRPRGLEQDSVATRRSDRVLGYSVALSGFCPLFIAIFLYCGAPMLAGIVAVALVALVANTWLLRQTGQVRRAAMGVLVIGWLTYTALASLQGGHNSPALLWFATLPILTVALFGPRAGLIGWLLATVLVTAFYIAKQMNVPVPCELTPFGLRFVEYTGLLGLMLCMFALMFTFDAMESAVRKQIADALTQATLADRAKSEFLANMSHEIRTPLNAMLGFADLLLENAIEREEVPDALRTIKRNGEHLLTIISDILDVSKIESGQMTLEQVPCDPAAVIQDVLQLIRSRAEPKGLYLAMQTEGSPPRQIVCDPTRLKQILLNLLGNAVKFTERGGITIVLRGTDVPVAAGRLQIAVVDTGIGMTGDQLDRLFKPFSQGDTSTTRRFGGTGLGLVISQRLAEMLGGEITVQSRVGLGTTFTLSLTPTVVIEPLSMPFNTPVSAVCHRSLPVLTGRRILVADDMPDNHRLLRFFITKTGAECVAVEDGVAAIAEVSAARRDGRPFDLILMDIQMPKLDGYAATQQLRAAGIDQPIIALTANSSPADREQCLAAGCDDFLSKPIKRDQLHDLMTHWLATAAELETANRE